LTSCVGGKADLDKQAYVNWVLNPNNGLVKEKQIGEYGLELQYRPLELIVLTENNGVQVDVMELRCEELSVSQYFNLKLKSKDPLLKVMDIGNQDEQDYYAKLDYFTNGIQADLKLIDGSDTLNCMISVFERTYDLAPYVTFALAFDNKGQNTGDKTLYFNGDKLGLGPVYLKIEGEEIKNTPNLILG
jgi:hypothetical protein